MTKLNLVNVFKFLLVKVFVFADDKIKLLTKLCQKFKTIHFKETQFPFKNSLLLSFKKKVKEKRAKLSRFF